MKYVVLAVAGLFLVSFPMLLVWASSGPEKVLRVNPKTGNYYRVEYTPPEEIVDGKDLKPRAIVVEQDFDFGSLDPNVDSSHVFKIKNKGKGTLRLRESGSTCKCIKAKVLTPEVGPGETAYIRVEWSTIMGEGDFNNAISVKTNDEKLPKVKFHVRGKIRYEFFSDPDSLVFSDLLPGVPQTLEVTLFSQKWDSFEILNTSCTLEGIEWEILPALPEKLEEIGAKCGYRFIARTTRDFPTGTHRARMHFKIQTDSEVNPIYDDVELRVHARGRISVYGAGINSRGELDLGHFRDERGAKASLIVKVRDEERQLAIKEVVAEPSFMRAELVPVEGEAANPGLYKLNIEIPKSAPAGNYRGRFAGQLKIVFDHPRIDDIKLNVDFGIED